MTTGEPNTTSTEAASFHSIDHVFGLRRSGHHAVIEWLKDCYAASDEKPIHVNSVFNRHLSFAQNWPDPTPEDIVEAGVGSTALLVSYEDVDYDERRSSPVFSTFQTPDYGDAIRETIVVRDWYNFVASRLKFQANCWSIDKLDGLVFGLEWSEVEKRWLRYADVAFNGGNDESRVIAVNYNSWFSDSEYRDQLATQYGLTNASSSLDIVPDFGTGSSFDGLTLQGKGRQMNVLNRWENLDPELLERYTRLISNPQLGEINRELFGIDQDTVLESVATRLAQSD